MAGCIAGEWGEGNGKLGRREGMGVSGKHLAISRPSPKAEVRNPKEGRNPKAEGLGWGRGWQFGGSYYLRSPRLIWTSNFGFWTCHPGLDASPQSSNSTRHGLAKTQDSGCRQVENSTCHRPGPEV